jgi:hypothetical protein
MSALRWSWVFIICRPFFVISYNQLIYANNYDMLEIQHVKPVE